MSMEDVAGLLFDVNVAGLVRDVVAEARRLAGAECVYIAHGQVRAAIVPQLGGKDAQGVFLIVESHPPGATIVRPRLAKSEPEKTDLQSGSLTDVISTMKIWHHEVRALREYDDPEETKNPNEVSGGLPETDRNKF
ncbi:hypothetical protein [Granulicella mallensis]|uniref:Uncharacterized protein n=1 Tax=Granulicella mallensis (strain ATCC BAA-1857 / DSM 23137 / MP5ACTX8) TaxID=682795 RepID=G8NR89_GRAMM|nr:hypothetical protein [Granulicella mallensis]AEU36167.1 hypothetical protein AciX8_1830 [Granulicella mallensis MP5ACTX8]